MLKITNGRINRAQKVVLYGSEGIGKSTLAAQFPNPLFIDTEGGTAHMDVRRIERPDNWTALISILKEIAANPGICGSLVIDTADWAEQLAVSHICAKFKKNGIEDFGYGKGYTYLAEEFTEFFTALDAIIAAGMNVVVTAHAKMRKFEQPDEMGAYDRWEMKLSKHVAPLFKEWCDMLLFLNYQTYVVTTENKVSKAQGGKRIIHTSHHPCWDAKNRHGLPPTLDLDYGSIAHLFGKAEVAATPNPIPAEAPVQQATPPTVRPPMEVLKDMMMEAQISAIEIQEIVGSKGHFPTGMPMEEYPEAFITGWIIPNFKRIVETVESNPDRLPF